LNQGGWDGQEADQREDRWGGSVPARLLSRRYLLVPVRPAHGVFHPKLNLLLGEAGGQVQCGSNNLTRSGCSSNLELLNAFAFNLDSENGSVQAMALARQAFSFFQRACNDAEAETGRIASEWLRESLSNAPWLATPVTPSESRNVRLLHTYEGSLWERLRSLLRKSPPHRLLVISPFHDIDGALLRQVHATWPRCRIDLVVQDRTTTLDVASVRKLRGTVRLFELQGMSRRLHAKLTPNGK
jgi:hypothetical protein